MHTIRLGPPWDVTSTPAGTRHARKFGRPRTLAPDERVWLVCAHIPGAAEVHVNGATVEVPTPFAVDITTLLSPRNEVIFTVASEAPIGAVVLEIRPA
ncbi:hypothetical protein J8F10_24920 [Gemmata sp. G18]|uniref:Uncharacterized protein n=1 Tax=Gemmata palustris TaxID=2822762 RepID=A0ABS5BXS9_9BACT|nr:hypothetical protein [Gemmata palustris]MBP3958504.1 hypothetical protein [Gemmata palustris]